MDPITIFILSSIAQAVLDAMANNAFDAVINKLKGDPAKKDLEQAIGKALSRYATGERYYLAQPLLGKDSLLALPGVASEISKLLRFDIAPDLVKVGRLWRESLEDPPPWRNFEDETALLFSYIQNELKATGTFRTAFQNKSLESISINSEVSAQSLGTIVEELNKLISIMDGGYGILLNSFNRSPANIRCEIRDFTPLLLEKTAAFVGRRFIFEDLNKFIDQNPCGYYFIAGDPGIGKSAIAAKLVRDTGCVHHFNIRPEGINRPSDFLRNVCAQLIATYQLDHTIIPPEALTDAGFLLKLLEEVSAKVGKNEKCIIVIDALDEVDEMEGRSSANLLYLPRRIPSGIFIIATTRVYEGLRLQIENAEQKITTIQQDSSENRADIEEFILGKTELPSVKRYLSEQNLDAKIFTRQMINKAQGNFMYLHFVLPEIERGAYAHLEIENIPAGLKSYYEDHWRRIRRKTDELSWFEDKLPVVIALTISKEPVSLELLSRLAFQIRGQPQIMRMGIVRAVLADFQQFIYITEVMTSDEIEQRYRWYHNSFFEFVAKKEDVKEERISLIEWNKKIAKMLWDELDLDSKNKS